MSIHRVVYKNLGFYSAAEDTILLLNMQGFCLKISGFSINPQYALLQGRHFQTAWKGIFTPSFFSHSSISPSLLHDWPRRALHKLADRFLSCGKLIPYLSTTPLTTLSLSLWHIIPLDCTFTNSYPLLSFSILPRERSSYVELSAIRRIGSCHSGGGL